jgi:hypothetical protein
MSSHVNEMQTMNSGAKSVSRQPKRLMTRKKEAT